MSKIKDRLSRKLSIGIMLLAAPIFIITLALLFLQSRHLIRQEAKDHSNSILETTILKVRHYMGSIENSTNANAWLMEEHFTPDSLEIISRKILQMNPGKTWIEVFDNSRSSSGITFEENTIEKDEE